MPAHAQHAMQRSSPLQHPMPGQQVAVQPGAGAVQIQRPEYKDAAKEKQEAKPPARGKITSFLALLFLVAAVAVAGIAVPKIVEGNGTLYDAITLVLMLPVAGIFAWFAVIVGTRSVAQPKGTQGRGRGLVAVLSAPLAPVVASVLLVVSIFGMAKAIVSSGALSKIQKDDGGMTIVYPGGRFDIDQHVTKFASQMGLLPENTLNSDSSIPLSTSNGSIYMGTTAIDLSSVQGSGTPKLTEDQFVALTAAVEQLERNGYSVALGPNEKSATVTDANGETLTVTLDSTSRRKEQPSQGEGNAGNASSGVTVEGTQASDAEPRVGSVNETTQGGVAADGSQAVQTQTAGVR